MTESPSPPIPGPLDDRPPTAATPGPDLDDPVPVFLDLADYRLRAALTRAVLVPFDADTKQFRLLSDEEWAAAWPVARRSPELVGVVDRVLAALDTLATPATVEHGVEAPASAKLPITVSPPGSPAWSFGASRGGRRRYVTPWRPA